MKYDSLRAFEKHLENAAPQHFSNLYVILAKEYFDGKTAVDCLLQALLPNQKRDLSLRIFDGGRLNLEELLGEIRALSFLSPKKIIWIQEIDKSKKNIYEVLEEEFSRLPRSTTLILTGSSLAKNLSFYKKAEKAGIILELAELKPWEREKKWIEWLNKQAAAARKLMSYQACQLLVSYAGTDQAILASEMEKLLCYVGERNEITSQDIKAICTQLNADTIWQLGEAIFQRNTTSALQISRALLLEGHPFLPLLRQLRTQFQIHYQLSEILAQGGSVAEISQEFPYMKGTILDRHIRLTQIYGKADLRQGLLLIDQIELQAKNSQIEESLLADLLITHLTQNSGMKKQIF